MIIGEVYRRRARQDRIYLYKTAIYGIHVENAMQHVRDNESLQTL